MILRSGKRIRAGAPPSDGAPALILSYIEFFHIHLKAPIWNFPILTSILKPRGRKSSSMVC